MNLKLRLTLIITLLLFILTLTGIASSIFKARQSVQVEIASTAILALHMLDAEVLLLGTETGWDKTIRITDRSVFRLQNLTDIRHLKIEYYDTHGRLIDSNRFHIEKNIDMPPQWYINLVDSVTDHMPVTRRKVYQYGHVIGELVITPDPSSEIIEAWGETKSMLLLFGLFFLIANTVIYFAVGKALQPIETIIAALTKFESGALSSRLPRFALPELSSISDKFNVMAETLERSIANNHHLTQKIIQLQEDERKNLAQELHDEIGQHLTAIHVDAASILKAKTITSMHESARAIDTVSRQMMEIVHTMLHRLRPSGLDELGLKAAIKELIGSWQQRNPDIHIKLDFSGDLSQLDETILLTVYRLIQECLTNIYRHAQAKHVQINIQCKQDELTVSIKDDGQGFEPNQMVHGFGLAGMKERVAALNGKFHIHTAPGQGVHIQVVLPCSRTGDTTL